MGWGNLRVWNDDEIAPEHGLPAASACGHGDHHLCPRGRDHAQGQPRQLRPHGSRRRAGDVRRHRHPPRRIQSGAASRPRSSRSGSLPAATGGQPTWGAKPFPKADRSGTFRHARQRLTMTTRRAADPRRCARAGRDAESRRNDRIHDRRRPARLSRAGGGRDRDQRRARQRARRRGDHERTRTSTSKPGRRRNRARRRGSVLASFPALHINPKGDIHGRRFSYFITRLTVTSRRWPKRSRKARVWPGACRHQARAGTRSRRRREGRLLQARPESAGREDRGPRQLRRRSSSAPARASAAWHRRWRISLTKPGGLWAKGALQRQGRRRVHLDATQHGGQETTLFSIITNLLHFGMVDRRPRLRPSQVR